MPLRTGDRLPRRFEKLVNQADRVDVAVAWVRSCGAVDALAQSNAKVRIIAGISGHFTDPSTLKRLVGFKNVELRIVPDEATRLFHPKYYCFHGKKAICWVGSANLTGGGFGGNVELVHEFELKREEDRTWFECLWESLEPDPWPAIQKYEDRYTPPKRIPRPATAQKAGDLPSLADVETWEQFVRGLKAYDAHYQQKYGFGVLGETHSWLHTIRLGHDIVMLNDWVNLTSRECQILRGVYQDDGEGNWELLGPTRGGGTFVFNPERMPEVRPIRMEIQKKISAVLQADMNKIVAVATGAMSAIKQLRHVEDADRGIGPAATTRWLALARPDCLVSINSASAGGLGDASGLPQQPGRLADVYSDLIAWVHSRPWFHEFNGRQPIDPLERNIWNCRAALVDVFVMKQEEIRE